MDDKIQNLILQTIDQTISSDDFARLQEMLEHDPAVRAEYVRLVNLIETLNEIAAEYDPEALAAGRLTKGVGTLSSTVTASRLLPQPPRSDSPSERPALTAEFSNWNRRRVMLAVALLMFVSGVAFRFGQSKVPEGTQQVSESGKNVKQPVESLIAGHAALSRSVDLQWADGTAAYRDGDVLPNGHLQFDRGLAEIDFFCGATLIVEGPATLNIESDWTVQVIEGRLRAIVPPAARGFIVKAADSEIVDLGTEFALEVGTENARVEVLDGEVELRGGAHDGDHLFTGERQLLKGTAQPGGFDELSTVNDIRRLRTVAALERFGDWKKEFQKVMADERLIACYPIAQSASERLVRNAAPSGAVRDAQLVGPVERTFGRFGSASTGLEFDRPGSRLRTRIDGVFQAFTFSAWVRIDNLEHVYNALFMADGYENGEPHWQIRDDGRLMFSVMVDDTQEVRVHGRFDKQVVRDAGLHRVYMTKPFWDISKSGQWFHIVAVYDPIGRRVVQYVNGQQLSSEVIIDRFHISKLRIGPAEIGNWGQPFRRTPWFAVRNLNGTIDELAIFNTALNAEEILSLYEQGKPIGY